MPRGTGTRGRETALELHVANDYDGRGKVSECSLLLEIVPYDFLLDNQGLPQGVDWTIDDEQWRR